jgi:PilZ domain
MGKSIEYEGYTIQSRPYYDANWDKWQIRILISCDSPQGVRTREFSSMVLYGTEQEADIHGATFGQHLIDGKVEGQSIMDMKMEDRRAMPRLRVQFRTTFTDASRVEGMGLMLDLSLGGCRIDSPVPMIPGFSLELLIHVPDVESPIIIEAASVQWVSGLMFGLAFFRLKEDERQRLEQLINHLMKSEPTAG